MRETPSTPCYPPVSTEQVSHHLAEVLVDNPYRFPAAMLDSVNFLLISYMLDQMQYQLYQSMEELGDSVDKVLQPFKLE